MGTIPAGSSEVSSETLRVLKAFSNQGVAWRTDGSLVEFHFRRRLQRPLPGDHIRLDKDNALAEIRRRRNCFGRGDQHGRLKPLAANLDRVVIVLAPEPAPSRDILHRYLAAAHIQDIQPLVVINKADLPIPDKPPFSHFDTLADLGYEILRVQCLPEADLGVLPGRIADQASLFVGQSGVGKSSLLNALIPDLAIQTNALSRVTGKGTHTTTSAFFNRLPGGGWAVDTPGVWEYSLWAMDAGELQKGFPEFAVHAARCRFRDCRHDHEPACEVKKAVEAGDVPAFRHRAWLRLLEEQVRLSGR